MLSKLNNEPKAMGYNYVSKMPDETGDVPYTADEHKVWQTLINRQNEVVQGRACDEFLEGLKKLDLPTDRIPQNHEVSDCLRSLTGWSVAYVPAVIPAEAFFGLLANREFPAATFIRVPEELDYLEEPDIFHEIYGHCPLLANQAYAAFMQAYGQMALNATKAQRKCLFRLFWFTIEFGLLNTPKGKRIYGGGILSSKSETIYSLDQECGPELEPLDVLKVLRTPFRIDMIQPQYFLIDGLDSLHKLLGSDIMTQVDKALELGDLPRHVKFDQKPTGGVFDDRPC